MIKITIIIILIFLLLITLYSYYCLSSRMVNFERARLEYILQKEDEVKIKESRVKVITDCSNKNELYQTALININKILSGISIESENSVNVINGDIVAKSEITQSCSNKHKNDDNSLISQEIIDVKILNEVPSEYIK